MDEQSGVGEGVWEWELEWERTLCLLAPLETTEQNRLRVPYPYRSRQLIGRGTVCRAVVMGGVRTKRWQRLLSMPYSFSFFDILRELAGLGSVSLRLCRSLLLIQ
jgi:hypothetical protein